MNVASPEFWIALMQIIGVNIVLSGDNAVVIALAARSLPAAQQKRAIAWGSGAAVVMRIVLTIVAVELLRLPYLKLVGAALLFWIAIQLLIPEDEQEESETGSTSMASAIRTILLADLVMSLDNVIAVAAAAKGHTGLLIIGLAISIPLVIFASRLLLVLMDRFPIIITLGAALLGWVAGDMAVTDPVVRPWIDLNAPFLHWGAPLAGAIAVVLVGKWLAARTLAKRAAESPPVEPVPASVTDDFRRLLLAADGSPPAQHAATRVVALRQQLANRDVEIHVVNVQRPLSGDVSSFVGGKSVDEYHRERSDQALVPIRAVFESAGVPFKEHVLVGQPGPTIARLAHEIGCHMIIMGTHSLESRTGAVIGSVAQSTLEHAGVPVLMVK